MSVCQMCVCARRGRVLRVSEMLPVCEAMQVNVIVKKIINIKIVYVVEVACVAVLSVCEKHVTLHRCHSLLLALSSELISHVSVLGRVCVLRGLCVYLSSICFSEVCVEFVTMPEEHMSVSCGCGVCVVF